MPITINILIPLICCPRVIKPIELNSYVVPLYLKNHWKQEFKIPI